MKIDIYIEIRGDFESRELWDAIETTGVNVTDLGDTTLVYGNIEIAHLARIITTCAAFGDCHIHTTRPIN